MCPPVPSNREYNTRFGSLSCESPFLPRCLGATCGDITWFQQHDSIYVTRTWGGGKYNENEAAELWFPYNGTLAAILMDVKEGDELSVMWEPGHPNMARLRPGDPPVDMHTNDGNSRVLRWRTGPGGPKCGV